MKTSRLKTKYIEEVAPKLKKELGIKNVMSVPKLEKIVINSGLGEATKNKDIITKMQVDIAAIAGQAPSVRKANKSVASFSLREGVPIGLKVTLRGDKMWNFMDKLCSITLPRIRDFRGIGTKSFDSMGNYTLGISEHTIFPEIDFTKSSARGLEITFVTSAKDVESSKLMLTLLGMPFAKES